MSRRRGISTNLKHIKFFKSITMSERGAADVSGPVGDGSDAAEQAKAQWQEALMAFAKSNAMGASAPFLPAGVPFPMPFPHVRISWSS